MKARVIADRAFQKAEVDPRLYGSFVEHTGRAVYGGIYEPTHPTADRYGFRGDVEEIVKELRLPMIRYPGGNFLSGYNWEDGVGPVENRPVKRDAAWRSLETNEVGTNEFIAWARRLGIEPMMAVNLGTRGADEARALLEYCNSPGGSYYSDLRRKHGYEEPHKVKLWCLGNEMDGPWQICQKTPMEYARLAKETAKVMKMVDPDIELVACGSSNDTMPTMGVWEQTVLEECYPFIDYLSMHLYIDNREDDTPLFLAKPVGMEEFIHTIVSVCDYVGGKLHSGKKIHISFDEWNVAYHSNAADAHQEPWQIAPPLGEDVYNFQDAVAAGLMLLTLMRNADRVKVACHAQLINVIGAIMTKTGGKAWRQTIYYPFLHACRYGLGTVLHTVQQSDCYGAGRFQKVPYLDAVTIHREETGELTVFCVNRSETEELELELELRGFEGYGPVEQIGYHCGDKYAVNTAEKQPVVPVSESGPEIVAGKARAKLKPLSWNVLRFAKK